MSVLILIMFAVCVSESASDETLTVQQHFSRDANDFMYNKNGPQIMPLPPPDARWKIMNDQSDVKNELRNLDMTYIYDSNWPKNKTFGAVSAVTFDKDQNVVVFHRVDRVWTLKTFDLVTNVYLEKNKGPITENTLVALDRESGNVLYEWGRNLFYMPHGLTIDEENNFWVTDVALHQVMKFGPKGFGQKPLLKLGKEFIPGSGLDEFCKPTAVAVLTDGDFFVADGYCNSRILKFSKAGEVILTWGRSVFERHPFNGPPVNFFTIPHALTLARDKELLCVADRENGRVQCFHWKNGTFHSEFRSGVVGSRIFSVDYTPAEGGQLFVVNGPVTNSEVRGYVFDVNTKKLISKFGAENLQFSNPHDIAVNTPGTEVYVAELNPSKIHRFVRSLPNQSSTLSAKPTATVGDSTDIPQAVVMPRAAPGSTVLLVIVLIIVFALLTFGLAILVSRRRKRGKSISTPSYLEYSKLVSNNCDDC